MIGVLFCSKAQYEKTFPYGTGVKRIVVLPLKLVLRSGTTCFFSIDRTKQGSMQEMKNGGRGMGGRGGRQGVCGGLLGEKGRRTRSDENKGKKESFVQKQPSSAKN